MLYGEVGVKKKATSQQEVEVMTEKSTIEQLVEETIPIYTVKNPDPKTGKEDCRLKRIHKEGNRHMMRAKLMEIVKWYRRNEDETSE